MGRQVLDKILGFTMSKKLSVFIIATIAFFSDKMESEDWVHLAMVYIGAQAAVDIFLSLKNKNT